MTRTKIRTTTRTRTKTTKTRKKIIELKRRLQRTSKISSEGMLSSMEKTTITMLL